MKHIEKLRSWFYKNRRLLPWRENPSPYEVWISEVMLQQTQVTVVVPYFKRWMQLFPTIHHLSEAPEEKVIKAWEGLGYYARARTLHAGARYLTEHHRGELPSTIEALQKIKGIGPYTSGAILSFAYKKRSAAVDGNVARVLARYYGIQEAIERTSTQKKIQEKCQKILPHKEPWVIMESLIELGALVCQKKARCSICPLIDSCAAYRSGQTTSLPTKRAPQAITYLHRLVAVVCSETSLLIQKGQDGKVMQGLSEFPYFPQEAKIEQALKLPLTLLSPLPKVTHTFTRYKAFLTPYLYKACPSPIPPYHWVPFKDLPSLTFSAGHRQILHYL